MANSGVPKFHSESRSRGNEKESEHYGRSPVHPKSRGRVREASAKGAEGRVILLWQKRKGVNAPTYSLARTKNGIGSEGFSIPMLTVMRINTDAQVAVT